MAKGKRPRRKQKLEIVFDEEKRREFLTGFRKRKLERQKKAKVELEVMVKEEKKRIKLEVKEGLKDKLKLSYRPIPELEEMLKDEYEDEEVTVKILELNTNELAKHNNWIGANRPQCDDDDDDDQSGNEAAVIESEPEEAVPGMGLTVKKNKKPIKVESKTNEVETKEDKELKSKKEISVLKRKETMKNLKRSKILQTKRKLDRVADKKKGAQERNKRIKVQNKEAKKRGNRPMKKKPKRKK